MTRQHVPLPNGMAVRITKHYWKYSPVVGQHRFLRIKTSDMTKCIQFLGFYDFIVHDLEVKL